MEKKFYVQPECEVLKLKFESLLQTVSGETGDPSNDQDSGDGGDL